MKVIGIDPGKNGAFAVIENGVLCSVFAFTKHERSAIARAIYQQKPEIFFIEKVNASPQQGVVSAFSFGRNAECVECAATLTEIPVKLVKPVEWQSAVGKLSGGDKKTLLQRAKELHPEGVGSKMITRDTADAVLIAHYGYKWRMYNAEKI